MVDWVMVGSIATALGVVVAIIAILVAKGRGESGNRIEAAVQNAGHDLMNAPGGTIIREQHHHYPAPPPPPRIELMEANPAEQELAGPVEIEPDRHAGRRRGNDRPDAHVETAVCDEGPHPVRPGTMTVLHLDVPSDATITGKLDGDGDFDFWILSERKYVALRNDEDPNMDYGGDGRRAYSVKWTPRGRGPWVLLLEAPGRRNPRSVYVYLRATKK